MSFMDISFPADIAYGSAGGPKFNTSVITVKSGREKRNINWEYPRIEYNVATGIQDVEELQELIEFFHTVYGKGHSFRFRDKQDYKSCRIQYDPSFDDRSIGTGDGSTVDFQIYKIYQFAGQVGCERKITKPVVDTVLVGVGGSEMTSGWSVDYSTGVITFDSAPADGANITAGFVFDIEARFDTDTLSTNLEDYQIGTTEVPVIELKR